MATKAASTNKGLTLRINLFPVNEEARLKDAKHLFKGQVTNEHTKVVYLFNDAGKLLSKIGEWNTDLATAQQKELKAQTKAARVPKKG